MQVPKTQLGEGAVGQTQSHGAAACQWILRRNCAISPYQLLAVFLSVCLVSLGIAVVWSALGQWVILPYAVVECLALGVAFVFYCRHAQDRESVSLAGSVVRIESLVGGVSRVTELPRDGIWVQLDSDDRHGLVSFRSGVQRELVGRFVDLEHRKRFVSEFRQAVQVS
jgi:uncharacterized membrane protein